MRKGKVVNFTILKSTITSWRVCNVEKDFSVKTDVVNKPLASSKYDCELKYFTDCKPLVLPKEKVSSHS